MSDHLRFTPDEYRSLLAACNSVSSRAPVAEFQPSLVRALRPTDPTLAQRVADWRDAQVCVLLYHLKGIQDPAPPASAVATEVATQASGLSILEWRSVVQACSLIWLRDDSLASFKSNLVEEIAPIEPVLADKLAQLSDDDVFVLYRRVKSGRRWCP